MTKINSMKFIIFPFLLICLVACVSKRSEESVKDDLTLPSFNLLLVDSNSFFKTDNIPDGKPFVLLFINPKCPYCQLETTALLNKMDSLNKVQFYVFTNWPYSELKNFYNHNKLEKYPNVLVGLDYESFFIKYYKAQYVPYFAIYNKHKKLKKTFIGTIEINKLIQAVNE